MDLETKFKEARDSASAILERAKSQGRSLTNAEITDVEKHLDAAEGYKTQLAQIARAKSLVGSALSGDTTTTNADGSFSSETKGFLTPASVKSMVKSTSEHGIKALVGAGSSTTPVPLESNPIPLGQTGLGLLSLIQTKVRDTPKYSYLRQTVRTNNAAVVAPGGTKPVSVATVASIDGSLAVVAHLSEPTDRFVLEDNDDLERFLSSELTYGVIRKVTADAAAAFLATPGIQTVATTATRTTAKDIDGIYAAASLVTDAGFTPNLLIVSRSTYDAMRVSKDSENRYLAGNPFEGGTNPGVWGMNVLISPDVANNKALVLDTNAVGLSIDRQGIRTDWDAISGFATNTVKARTEGRFGYDVFATAGIAAITFTA
jgi:HK97 family phage major capsid protein